MDKFGAPRAFAEGNVSLHLEGPGILVGDNPFDLASSGGIGAVYIRTMVSRAGYLKVTATHPQLPPASVELRVSTTCPIICIN